MAYQLKSATIRTNNSDEGLKRIDELWQDVASGKLAVLFDSAHTLQQGISPISEYSNYQKDETGDYDLSIIGVASCFFEKMEGAVETGQYKRYHQAADDPVECAKSAWDQVWSDQKAGIIKRAFIKDYESIVPAEYAKDGQFHCCLYISVQP